MSLIKKFSVSMSVLGLMLGVQEASAGPHYNVNDYYQVYKEGRIYVFDDLNTYLYFMDLGETPFRLTRIGSGPEGETVVFGLQKKDKKMSSGLGSVALYEGKAEGAGVGFYGEVVKEGRIYVFSNWSDLKSFLEVGEAPYRYTDIGAGPKGETVVYVLNKDNKKNKPDDLIALFKKTHKM